MCARQIKPLDQLVWCSFAISRLESGSSDAKRGIRHETSWDWPLDACNRLPFYAKLASGYLVWCQQLMISGLAHAHTYSFKRCASSAHAAYLQYMTATEKQL